MNINVTVDSVDLASEIDGHYVQTGEEDYTRHPLTLADMVAAKILEDLKRDDRYSTLKDRARDIRDEEIREQLRPLIAEAIDTPIQRTSEFGTPRGEPVQLTELIIQEVHKYLQKSDGYGRDSQTTVQKLIRDAVDRTIKTELSEVINQEKAKVVAAVRAKAADLIAEAVKQGVGR